jgi:MerR family transcriptional regulator/heat shock protein HspR
MSEKRHGAVFVISVAAELSGMHPQTLRIYERKGLIDPYRTPGGTRRYSQDDIDRLNLIQELTAKGLNLEGVKQVIELQNEVLRLRHEVADLRQDMERQHQETQRLLEQTHRSYRHEIVLRSDLLPQSRRDQKR